MSKKGQDSKITFATSKVQAANLLSGAVITEFLYLSLAFATQFIEWVLKKTSDVPFAYLCLVYVFVLATIIAYLWARGGLKELWKIILSGRIDIYICFILGVIGVWYFSGLGHQKYSKLALIIKPEYTAAVLLIIFSFALVSLIRPLILSLSKPTDGDPIFISDGEVQELEDDLLEFSAKAKIFAERLYNGGSRDSVVFGIDAPWGIGKTSFLNFCTKHLETIYPKKIIVYRFDPLKHEDPAVIQEKFISGLVKSIQKSDYIPEISSLMARYSRILKGKMGLRFFGISLEPNAYSAEEAIEDLEDALKALHKKIIIIIDDLDRLDYSSVKNILFSIKKSFALPNLTYVLCYDTENIADLDDAPEDHEKVGEFLEKFVNIKLSLFLSPISLAKYVSDNFYKVLSENDELNPVTAQRLINAIEGIKDIYKSSNYHLYQKFLNDVRKLKRMVNLIISLDIESTDFANSDLNKSDLIHLLLIYINYPNVFRKIYDTEIGEASGFFSLVSRHDIDFPRDQGNQEKYGNSIAYQKYVESLGSDPAFLIDKIFNARERFKGLSNDEPDEAARHTYACFNGKLGGRNLQAYLNLIANLSKPSKTDQYNFYLHQLTLFRGGKRLQEIFSGDDFANNGERQIQEFWRILVNNARLLNPQKATDVIVYLAESLPNHSFIEMEEAKVGLRTNISRYLAILLDRVGWTDGASRVDNSDQQIKGIADWIFGKGGKTGVLHRLLSKDRGTLGTYDALLFRLQCSADRDGSLFNLTRALSLHSQPPGPVTGDVRAIAVGGLREITQVIYNSFKENFVSKEINFFSAVDDLSLKDLTGNYYDHFIASNTERGMKDSDISRIAAASRSHIKSFCIYQLGNSLINSGVGCGYFDEVGTEDSGNIKIAVNDYLFGLCFNPDLKVGGYKYFLDYLLMSFDFDFNFNGGVTYRPNLAQITRVLEFDGLKKYWSEHRDSIIKLGFDRRNDEVHTPNYSTTYKEGLPQVYEILDKIIEPKSHTPEVPEIYG